MAKILVVEDEEIVRESIVELLELEDYTVISAEDGLDGFEKAKNELPDIIISDIAMPKMDGYKLLDSLKDNESTSTIPVIFLSAKADLRDIRTGMQLGADDYITKPFQRKDLFDAISSRLTKVENISKKNENKISEIKLQLATILPHELRTPLNGIISTSQFLIENKISDEDELLQLHNTIYNSANRLNRLIINYLLYAETELIKNKVELIQNLLLSETNSPKLIIENVVSHLKTAYFRENNITIQLENANLKIDPDYFTKICEEVLDNAFKFTHLGMQISITSETNDKFYILEIYNETKGKINLSLDNIGAYKQENRNIFEQQGSGMGLAIVKNLMQIFRSVIEIENNENNLKIILKFPII